jgi:GT2 family glycosyltransferase
MEKMVSIIIITFGKWDLTKQCLDSLFNAGIKQKIEVIVVDNGSKDNTVKELKKDKRVKLIINHAGSHFSNGCNVGVKHSTGEYLLFLNNDTIIKDDFLTPMVNRIGINGVGIVGARCLYQDGTIQHCGVGIKKNSGPVHVYKRWPGTADEVMIPRYYQSVTAACMLVERKIFKKIGGFDEVFKTGKEDVDFCLKAGKAGVRILYEPLACITHLEHQSPGRHKFDDYNRKIYKSRWRGKVRPDMASIVKLQNAI